MSRWFNPHDPVEIGLEWQGATRNISEPVDFAREIGHHFVLPSTVNVESLMWHSPGPVQSSSPDTLFFESWVLATIYEVGSEREFGEPKRAQTPVTGGSTTGTIMGNTVLGPATNVQEALSVLDGAFIRLDPSESIRTTFSAASSILTPFPRILNVTFDVYASPIVTGTANLIFGFRTAAGTVFDLAAVAHTQAAGGKVYSWSTGEMFLAAYDYFVSIADDRRRPWLIRDINDLAAGNVEFYIRNDGSQVVDINWVSMSVDYCAENRVAVGGQERGSRHVSFTWNIVGWQDGIELVEPLTGATGVTLLQGREYALTLTRATDAYLAEQVLVQNGSHRYQSGAARAISALASSDGFPLDAVEYLRDTRGLIIGDARPVDRGYSIALMPTSASPTLPYVSNPYSFANNVDLSQLQQEITTTQTGAYRYVRLTARKIGQPANLVVDVAGATTSISSDEFDLLEHDPNGWATITLELNQDVIVQANANVVVLVTKGFGANRWEVPTLFTQASFLDAGRLPASTYGGTGQRGTGAFGFSDEVDYAITLLTPAPAVTGLSVERLERQLTPVDETCPAPGRITALDYANICWDNVPIVSGGAFSSGYIEFPGTTENYVWAPDAAALDITGDLTIVARVALDDWTPGGAQAIVSKFDVSFAADQRSYMLRVTSLGQLEFIWSTAGTLATQLSAVSTDNIDFMSPGGWKWVASTIDVDNGAAGRTIRFWTSNDGVAWTQLGSSVVQAGVTSIFNSTARLTLGCHSVGLQSLLDGKISDIRIANNIGGSGLPGAGTVFELRNTNIPSNAFSTFAAQTGQTLTVQRSGDPATRLVPGQFLTVTGAPDQDNFCAWEVERREGDDDAWQLIARITERNNRCISDYEGLIGVSTDYRVRLCRLDGMCGDWAVVTGFVRQGPTTTPQSCQGLIFTSNENPNATLAYPLAFENSPTENFAFYESEVVVLERLHMRDYMVAFRPLERGGVRFQRTMLVNAVSLLPELLDEGFRDLRDLAWDTLSYVAVLDTRGRRWYAAVIIPSGEVRWTKQMYLATVDIVETTNRSSVIDVRSA